VSASLSRALAAEAVGTAWLVATVIGSGLTAERLAGGNGAIALLGNTLATGAILCTLQARAPAVPYAVGLYISAAYWFTASTSFANPAVTVARSLTNTFSGI
jgi:glycerol uptake facilitator-like aquaporin